MSDDYSAAADWAECDMTLPRNSTSARRGREASGFGRDLLVLAGGPVPLPDSQRRATPAQMPVAESCAHPDDGPAE